MNILLVLLIATFVVLSHQQLLKPSNMTEIRQAWRRTVEPHMSSCMCQTGVKLDLLNGFFDRGELPEDPCFKCNLRCWAQQLQVMSSTGIVDARMLRQQAAGVDDAIAIKCSAVPGTDLCQKAHNILRCVIRILSGQDPYPGSPSIVNINPSVSSISSIIDSSSPSIIDEKLWAPLQYLLATK